MCIRDRIEIDVKKWVDEQMEAEVARLKEVGQPVIRLPVRNCSVVRQVKDVVNRVEVDSAFGFEAVVVFVNDLEEDSDFPVDGRCGFADEQVAADAQAGVFIVLRNALDDLEELGVGG